MSDTAPSTCSAKPGSAEDRPGLLASSVAANGIDDPISDTSSFGAPTAGLRKFQPVYVATGTACSTDLMPARSLPSSSTWGTRSGRGSGALPGGLNQLGRLNTRNRRECDGLAANERAVAQLRILAGRRGTALPHPAIHRGEQSTERPPVLHGVVELLAGGSSRRELTRRMLGSRQKVNARVVGRRYVSLAVGRRMRERCGAGVPVLNRAVGEKDFWLVLSRAIVVEQPVGPAADRIACRRVGERESSSRWTPRRRWACAPRSLIEIRPAPAMCAMTPS